MVVIYFSEHDTSFIGGKKRRKRWWKRRRDHQWPKRTMVLLDVIGLSGSRMLICRCSRGWTIVLCYLVVLWTQVDFQNWFPSILASQNLPLFETQHTSWPSKNSTNCSRKQRVPGVVTIVRLHHSYSTCRGDRTGASVRPLFSC